MPRLASLAGQVGIWMEVDGVGSHPEPDCIHVFLRLPYPGPV